MKSDIVVQSNAPWPEELAANGPLRINSGFYRVRSNPKTILAFDAIVAHAQNSSMTEQPSFYIVLCGGKQGANIKGDNSCVYHPPVDSKKAVGAKNKIPDNEVEDGEPIEVDFLNRLHYPNGAVAQLWEIAANISTTNPEVVILHNNWLRGLGAKMRRMIDQRLWWYDRDNEFCDYTPNPVFEFNWNVDETVGEE
jgi:hypothetical protein